MTIKPRTGQKVEVGLDSREVLEAQKDALNKLTRDIGQLKLQRLGSTLQFTPKSGGGKKSTPVTNEEDEDDVEFAKLADSLIRKNQKMKSLKLEEESVLNDSFSKSMRILGGDKTPAGGRMMTSSAKTI